MVSITAFSGASIRAMVFGLPLVFGIGKFDMLFPGSLEI